MSIEKIVLEKYFEPITGLKLSPNFIIMDRKHIEYLTPELLYSEEPIWVNPVGGLGTLLCYPLHLNVRLTSTLKNFVLHVEHNIQNFYESSCYSRNRSSCCWKLCCV